MADLVHLMQAHFKKLIVDFEVQFSAEQVSHPGERGGLLEEALKNFLTNVLPSRVGIGSGQIVEALEKRPSNQIDIILYDALNYPLLLNEKPYQLFISESVLTVIEVKSTLNKTQLAKGLMNIASVKKLRKFPLRAHAPTIGALFSYKTSWKRPKSMLDNITKYTTANPMAIPDLICSLEPGFILAATNTMGVSVSNMGTLLAGAEKENTFPPDKFVLIRPLEFSKEHVLLWFYLLLIDHLNRSLNIGVTMGQYIKSSTAWSTDVL